MERNGVKRKETIELYENESVFRFFQRYKDVEKDIL